MNSQRDISVDGITLFSSLTYDLETIPKGDRWERLQAYFKRASDNDASWALALLLKRVKRKITDVKTVLLWSREMANLPDWLIERSFAEVKDKTELAALILNETEGKHHLDLSTLMLKLESLHKADKNDLRQEVTSLWGQLSARNRVVLNKIITGTLPTYTAGNFSFDPPLTLRLAEGWDPGKISLSELLASVSTDHHGQPLAFGETKPWETNREVLDMSDNVICQRFWEGIRSQLVIVNDATYLWTEQRELVITRTAMMASIAGAISNNVILEGMIVGFDENGNLLSEDIIRRSLFRKTPDKTRLSFLALDLLKLEGKELKLTLAERTKILTEMVMDIESEHLLLANEIAVFEPPHINLLLREKSGQTRTWWYLKPKPFEMRAVLLYVESRIQKIQIQMELTLGVRSGSTYVPIAKAVAPEDEEIRATIRELVKYETTERFGPVRGVPPQLIFTLEFECVVVSKRRRAGISLKSPRIIGLLPNESLDLVSSLSEIKALLDENA
jgi:DNA ligase-1